MKAAKDYIKEPYARILTPDESGGFYAEILEFPGCFAQGETPDEAYRNLENSAESWIEACLDLRQEIPAPFSNIGYSGKIALRLPKSIHREAARMAERDGTSLNQFLVSAISARVGAEDLYGVLSRRLEDRIVLTMTDVTVEYATPLKIMSLGLKTTAINRQVLETAETSRREMVQ